MRATTWFGISLDRSVLLKLAEHRQMSHDNPNGRRNSNTKVIGRVQRQSLIGKSNKMHTAPVVYLTMFNVHFVSPSRAMVE